MAEVPALTAHLTANGFSLETATILLSHNSVRIFGVYNTSGSSSRTDWRLNTTLPSAFYPQTDVFRGLVSLKISMPTRLSARFLCAEPRAACFLDQYGDYRRDDRRGRNNRGGPVAQGLEPPAPAPAT